MFTFFREIKHTARYRAGGVVKFPVFTLNLNLTCLSLQKAENRLHNFGASCAHQSSKPKNFTLTKVKTDTFKTRTGKSTHLHDDLRCRISRAEMFIKRKITSGQDRKRTRL